MLCSVGSAFLIFNACPACIPKTWGRYWHPFWSISTGSVGVGYVLSSNPLFTYTNTLRSVPSGLTMTVSLVNGLSACISSHLGSALVEIAFGVGAVPVNVTLPEILAFPNAAAAGAAGVAAGADGAGV